MTIDILRKTLCIFLLSFVRLLIDSLFSVGFLAKNLLLCFIFMNSPIPIVFALVSFGLVVIGLRELIKELSVASTRKFG